MSFVSLAFLLFITVCVTVYYLIPAAHQWKWLLACSWFYYLSAGP